MTTMQMQGVICPGYQIASESGTKSQVLISNVYPDKREIIVDKTVFRQFPFFIKAGVVGIEKMHPGTINVDISPYEFSIKKPDYVVDCEWIDGIRETFWLTKISIEFNGVHYDAYIYYPSISEQHVARNHMVEVITNKIEGMDYGMPTVIHFDEVSVELVRK